MIDVVKDIRDRPRTFFKRSASTFIGPGEGAEMPGEEARRQPAMAAPIPKAVPMRTFATATIFHARHSVIICPHLRRGGDEDQSDRKVHQHRMKSTDQRHVTRTDRGRAAHIPFRVAWNPRGNNSRVSGSIEQTRADEPTPRFNSSFLKWAMLGLAVSSGGSVPVVRFSPARHVVETTASLADEVVGHHVHALREGHWFEPRSNDQHTVKPWFLGKLDVSPPG